MRPAVPVLAAVLAVLIAACGPAGQATHRPPPRRQVTLRGSLLRVRPASLTVREGPGPRTVRVRYVPARTPIYSVTSATIAAVQPGSCAVLRGERGATGTVAASVVVVASSVDDTCPAGSVPSPPPPADPSPSPAAPPPSASPSTSPLPGPVLLHGQVLSVGGGAIGVEGPQGDPVVVLMPPDVQVLFYQPGGPSALVVPSCVVVRGLARPHRTVAARGIVDWPPGTQC